MSGGKAGKLGSRESMGRSLLVARQSSTMLCIHYFISKKSFYFQSKSYWISVFFYTNRDVTPGCGHDKLKKITIDMKFCLLLEKKPFSCALSLVL
jgi:hypothetical protein